VGRGLRWPDGAPRGATSCLEAYVEIKIGVQHTNRELVLESTESGETVEKAIASALNSDQRLLVLTDEKGRRVVVPTDKLAYVEIGAGAAQRVGFGAKTTVRAG
jgi:hypothetical protein